MTARICDRLSLRFTICRSTRTVYLFAPWAIARCYVVIPIVMCGCADKPHPDSSSRPSSTHLGLPCLTRWREGPHACGSNIYKCPNICCAVICYNCHAVRASISIMYWTMTTACQLTKAQYQSAARHTSTATIMPTSICSNTCPAQ